MEIWDDGGEGQDRVDVWGSLLDQSWPLMGLIDASRSGKRKSKKEKGGSIQLMIMFSSTPVHLSRNNVIHLLSLKNNK